MKPFLKAAGGVLHAILVIALIILVLSLPFIITGENASEHWPVMMPDGQATQTP